MSSHFINNQHQHPNSQNSNRKDRPQLAPSLSSEAGPNSSSHPNYPVFSSDLEEMIPFPYIPYQYVSCEYRYDVKETSQPHSQPNQPRQLPSPSAAQNFAPYYMNPMPSLIPNFSDLPPNYQPMPGNVPPLGSASSMSGEELFEPAPFGPGPPIVTGERLKGPRGCNLFVFHLPNEITNWDLYLLFRRHGTILSVHIMVNKTTGLSKGYGFVSFANADDAQVAIETMDGFRLGKKRLKVQLKRIQDDNDEEEEEKHPYDQQQDRIKDLMVKRVESYETQIGGEQSRNAASPESDEVRRNNGSSTTASVTTDEMQEKKNGHQIVPECGNEEKREPISNGDTLMIEKPAPLMKPSAIPGQQPMKKGD